MGIEQILLPLFAGLASGAAEGVVYKSKQKQRQQERADDHLMTMITKNPDLLASPEMQKVVQRITGDKETAGFFSQIIQAKQKFEAHQQQLGFEGTVPGSTGETYQDYMPGGSGGASSPQGGGGLPTTNPTGVDQGGGTLLSGVGSLTSSQPPSSEIANLPPLGNKIVGKTSEGRPIVQNPDGSVSSHRNMIVGLDNKFYLVPTIFRGREVSPERAIEIVKGNNLKDPDTGKPLPRFNSQQEAETGEKILHDQMESSMNQQGLGGRRGSNNSIVGALRNKGISARELPPGVSVSRKVGNMSFNFRGQTPEVRRGTIGAMTEFLFPDKAPGESLTHDEAGQVLMAMQDYEEGKSFHSTRGTERAKQSPELIAGRVAEARMTKKETERARLEAQGEPSGLQSAQARQEAISGGGVLGGARAKITPIYGAGLTPNEMEVAQQGRLKDITESKTPLEDTSARMMAAREDFSRSLNQVKNLFSPKFIGPATGSDWITEIRKRMPEGIPLTNALGIGPIKAKEAKFVSAMSAAKDDLKRILSGMNVPEQEQIDILGQLPDRVSGTTEQFLAKLDFAQERAKWAMERYGTLVSKGRGETVKVQGVPPPSAPSAGINRSSFIGNKMPTQIELADPSNLPKLLKPEVWEAIKRRYQAGEIDDRTHFFPVEDPK